MRIRRGSNILFRGFTSFDFGTSITSRGGQIIFGKNFHSNEQVIFNADVGGILEFGDDCLVGPRCIFRTANHNFEDIGKNIIEQGHTPENISVGDDVWFGAGVIVLPGVNVGSHSVIGAGSVVSRDIPEYSIAAGVPAKVIKSRR